MLKHLFKLFIGLLFCAGALHAESLRETYDQKMCLLTRACTVGFLTPVPGSPFATAAQPREVAYNPAYNFAATANSFTIPVSMFGVDTATGVFTPIATSATGSTFPFSLQFSPDGNFLATANDSPSTIAVFSVNPSTGVLTPVAGSPFAATNTPIGLRYSHNGDFLAVANQLSNGVNIYTANSVTGVLTQVAGSPFMSGGTVTGWVAFTPDDAFLAVTNSSSNNITVFSVTPGTGVLTGPQIFPISAPAVGPFGCEYSPDGNFLAVASVAGTGYVSIFSADPGTGALTEITGSPFNSGGTGTLSVTYSPDGTLLAATNQFANSISIFSVNTTTGAITPVTGSPFATATTPQFASFSPGGNLFLAVPNFGTNQVSVYGVTSTIITLAPSTLPNGAVDIAYSQTIIASGGSAPYTYAVTAGILPTGLTLNPDGTLTGTPTTPGTFNFTITATDSATCTGSQLYTIVISGESAFSVSVTPSEIGIPADGTGSIVFTAIPQGGVGPYTYAWTGPNGFTSNLQTITIPNATALNVGIYTVIVTDSLSSMSSPGQATVIISADSVTITLPTNNTVTNNSLPLIAGTTLANTPVSIYANNILLGTTTSDNSGNFTFVPSAPLAPGTYALYATITINNITTVSNIVTITITGNSRRSPLSIKIREKYCSNI